MQVVILTNFSPVSFAPADSVSTIPHIRQGRTHNTTCSLQSDAPRPYILPFSRRGTNCDGSMAGTTSRCDDRRISGFCVSTLAANSTSRPPGIVSIRHQSPSRRNSSDRKSTARLTSTTFDETDGMAINFSSLARSSFCYANPSAAANTTTMVFISWIPI